MSEAKAEQLYNNTLKNIIYPLTGNKSTYMNDLDRVGRKLLGVKFKGVYPSDKIPKLNDLKPYCILNLDKSTQSGSHWVSVAKIHGEDSSIIYDSFSRPAKKIIPVLLNSGNGKIINSDLSDNEQKIEETDCGARSLSFLVVLDKYGVDVAKLI
jgi:hypothetical protein